jgi:hypothetical protein
MSYAGTALFAPPLGNTSDSRRDGDDVLDKRMHETQSLLIKLTVTVFRISSIKKKETVIQLCGLKGDTRRERKIS